VIHRGALLAAAVVASGCAGEGTAPRHRSCTASEAVVEAYVDRVATLASNARSNAALARFEQVTVAFEIDAAGSPQHLSVMSASTPLAAEAAREPFMPPRPFSGPRSI
jgi:hypothetical protein